MGHYPRASVLVNLEQSLRICLPTQFPGDAGAAGWELLLQSFCHPSTGSFSKVVIEHQGWAPIPVLEFSSEQNKVTHGKGRRWGQTMKKLMGNMMVRVINAKKKTREVEGIKDQRWGEVFRKGFLCRQQFSRCLKERVSNIQRQL